MGEEANVVIFTAFRVCGGGEPRNTFLKSKGEDIRPMWEFFN